jgi:predicted tellurium resistance membrane protein TerC
MHDLLLFPFADYWWLYSGFVIFVLAVLAFDLGVFSRGSGEVSIRAASVRSIVYILLALAFNVGLYLYFLKYGLGVILLFVGLKMIWLNQAFGGKFPIQWSLSIIAMILALAIIVSIAYTRVVERNSGDSTAPH